MVISEITMARLNEAYEVLSDPERRAEYDREREAPRGHAFPDEGESPAAASAAPGADRERRGPARRSAVGGAVKSASAAIKWQIGFFGQPVSALAGAAALILSAYLIYDLGGLALFLFPFMVVAFFWWWFLGSAILFVGWKVLRRASTLLRSRVRVSQRAVEGFSSGPAAEDPGTSWEDLRRHLAVLGGAAKRFILGLVRYFGWPISLIAAALVIWGLSMIATDTSLLDIVISLVVLGPVWVLFVFAVWLFFAVALFIAWRLLNRFTGGGRG